MTTGTVTRETEPHETSSDLLVIWTREGDPIPFAQRLLDRRAFEELRSFCRRVLLEGGDPGQQLTLTRILTAVGEPPEDWDAAVHTLAERPCAEGVEALLRWVPQEARYLQVRSLFSRLLGLGVAPDVLFSIARHLKYPTLETELAESAGVSPEAIAARAKGSPKEAFWLAFAARSAASRGEHRQAIELARDARHSLARSSDPLDLDSQVADISGLLACGARKSPAASSPCRVTDLVRGRLSGW